VRAAAHGTHYGLQRLLTLAPIPTLPRLSLVIVVRLVCVIASALAMTGSSPSQEAEQLRTAASFAGFGDTTTRSRALFTEAAKVITHPRCVNCHPATDHPLQGNDQHIHQPPVLRGEVGDGIPGLSCSACHGDRNVDVVPGGSYQSIPGNPRWGLAPIEMAWEGRSVAQICEQLKDPKRNGGRDLRLLQEHMAKDDVVAYGWHPGSGRDPVPGTQEVFAELIQAWIDTGASCP
jgi:hypothetical protein